MKQHRLALGLAGMLVCAATLPALAQEYPPDPGEITLGDEDGDLTTTFVPGETGVLTATDLMALTTYDTVFSQSPAQMIGDGRSREDGFLRSTFRIPPDAKPGPATLTLDPRGVEGANRTAGIRIVSVGVKAESGTPPGRPIGLYVGIAIALLLGGGALAMLRRSRHTKARSGNGREQTIVGETGRR